jgi:uncharacterized glyoxalase superfamily protein PhnB
VPAGGREAGGTFWQRIVPDWFGAWCARRDSGPKEPDEIERLSIAVYYENPVSAARWLAEAFGLACTRSLPEPQAGRDLDAEQAWLEFRVGRCSLMLFRAEGSPAQGHPAVPLPVTHVPWIYVDDLDAHLARASAAGAKIVEPIRQHGFRAYQAQDPHGHRWTFVQARPTMR